MISQSTVTVWGTVPQHRIKRNSFPFLIQLYRITNFNFFMISPYSVVAQFLVACQVLTNLKVTALLGVALSRILVKLAATETRENE
jgi:hypothetical protein